MNLAQLSAMSFSQNFQNCLVPNAQPMPVTRPRQITKTACLHLNSKRSCVQYECTSAVWVYVEYYVHSTVYVVLLWQAYKCFLCKSRRRGVAYCERISSSFYISYSYFISLLKAKRRAVAHLYMRARSHVSEWDAINHVGGLAVRDQVEVDCSVISVRDHCHTTSTGLHRQAVDQLLSNGDHPRWRIRLQVVSAVKNQRNIHLTRTACSCTHNVHVRLVVRSPVNYVRATRVRPYKSLL